MEFRQLRYFIEVAERQHMTEASEKLNVAQSAVSIQITKLEDELGVRLFERTGRNIRLTSIGFVFLSYVKKAFNSLDEAKQKIDEYLDPQTGTIKIGYPTSLANYCLPMVVSAFIEEYPSVAFQLRQGSYHDLIDKVKNGEIDIVFLGPVPTNEPDINTKILFKENIVALLPAKHSLANRKSLLLKELKSDAFILFPKGYILQKIVVEACKQAGFIPNITSEGEDMDAIKGLVSAGIGVSLLPESTFKDFTPRYTIKIPIELPQVKRNVGIITPKFRELAPSEKLFYQFAIDYFHAFE